METLFPFGLPMTTAFYLVLYLLTFALHHALMHYVVAGTIFVTWQSLFESENAKPITAIIRDWMPFLLSGAITAGVAPLLFVQILYPNHFYTANLLLGWRWMVVIPILILVFYLLYVVKSAILQKCSLAVRLMVLSITLGCLVFIGFCWTANHQISVAESQWTNIYSTGDLPLDSKVIVLRMLIWISGAFATLMTFVGWQIRITENEACEISKQKNLFTLLSQIAIGGILLSSLFSGLYLAGLSKSIQEPIFGAAGLPYLILSVLGVFIQLVGWTWILRANQTCPRFTLVMSTIGLTFSLIGMAAIREIIRLSQMDLAPLLAHHEKASAVSGFSLFVVFAVINVGLIGYCIMIIRKNLQRSK